MTGTALPCCVRGRAVTKCVPRDEKTGALQARVAGEYGKGLIFRVSGASSSSCTASSHRHNHPARVAPESSPRSGESTCPRSHSQLCPLPEGVSRSSRAINKVHQEQAQRQGPGRAEGQSLVLICPSPGALMPSTECGTNRTFHEALVGEG